MDKNEKGRLLTTDIAKKEWIGEIVSIDDPMKMLRVKAKVFGLFDGEEMTDDLLPWLFPANTASFSSSINGGTGDFDVPKVGTFIKVRFPNNDIYSGQYFGIPNVNETVRNTILAQEYEGVHVLRIDEDEDLQVFYTPLQGLVMKLKDCTVNITKEQSVHIVTKDGNEFKLNSDDETDTYKGSKNQEATLYIKCNKDVKVITSGNAHLESKGTTTIKANKVEVGTDGASESLVLGSSFKQIFESHTHIGFMGVPTSSAEMAGWFCPISEDNMTTKRNK